MCGITGYWTRSETILRGHRDVARQMADTLEHRGPDDSGVWTDRDRGVRLGFRRLAIIDLTDDGAQPMVSASGRYVLVFNGEIYNFRELRRRLETAGVASFRGRGDTEVLLAAIDRWGLRRACELTNGMFALAVWDRQREVLSLARDRIGIKPLYWGRVGGSIVFGSELAALCAFPEFEPRVERTALASLLRYAYIPSPHAIYEGIRKLEPGHIVSFSAPTAAPRMQQYWSASRAAETAARTPFEGTPDEAVSMLESVLGEAVERRLVSDVPLGAFLSGGIDSSTVVALMQKYSEEAVKTFSIGFEEAEYDESTQARAVAEALGTDHTELIVTPQECRDVIPKLAGLYDEPFADSSQIPTFLVSQLARRDVTVALSGDGGDELFGGYNRHLWGPRVWSVARFVPSGVRRAVAAGLERVGHDRWRGFFDEAGALSPPVRLPAEKLSKLANVLPSKSPAELYRRLVSQWDDSGSVVLRTAEPPMMEPELGAHTIAEAMMLLDATTYLPDDILTKVDRASMAVSLEARVPLLDHNVFEFAWSLPLDYKIRGGVTKWVLREVLARRLPRELFERPKMGFGVPIDRWLRNELKDWADDLLSVDRLESAGYFDPKPIQKAWEEHRSGEAARHHQLWPILVFESWRDRWMTG